MRERVEAILETIRPAVHAHGGEIELSAFDTTTGHVALKFVGACGSCALAPVTLRLGVEPLLKKEFPWVTRVTAE